MNLELTVFKFGWGSKTTNKRQQNVLNFERNICGEETVCVSVAKFAYKIMKFSLICTVIKDGKLLTFDNLHMGSYTINFNLNNNNNNWSSCHNNIMTHNLGCTAMEWGKDTRPEPDWIFFSLEITKLRCVD